MKNRMLFFLVAVATACAVPSWAKKPIKTPADTPVIGDFDAYLLDTLYNGSKTGGTGWAGGWNVSTYAGGAYRVDDTKISSNTLERSGNTARRWGARGSAKASRTITRDSTSTLTGVGEAWLSILLQRNDRISIDDSRVAFGTGALNKNHGDMRKGNGDGFGIDHSGGTLAVAKWVGADGGAITKGDALGATLADGETRVLAGKFEWNRSGGDDVFTLYAVPDSGAFDPTDPWADAVSITGDFKEDDFDTVSFWDEQLGRFDEIRLGTSAEKVLPGITVLSEPSIDAALVVEEGFDYSAGDALSGGGRDAGLESIVDSERFKELVAKHDLKLFGGPMLGCVTESSARIWVRTPGKAEVEAIVRKSDGSEKAKKTALVETAAENNYTALLNVEGLLPFTDYEYNVVVDGERVYDENFPRFRTFPPEARNAKFRVGFGACARYVPKNEDMWNVIASYAPEAFLLLGDNVYSGSPKARNRQRVHYYRRQLRPEFRRLTESTSIYAIWDDHDFSENDGAGGLDPFHPAWKFAVWRVFKENWNNPYYGGGEEQPGCWFDFSIGDIDFFMLDGRYYRSGANGARARNGRFEKGNEAQTMLGPQQLQWLLEGLKQSDATFKVIASPVQWTNHADKGGIDSWWGVKHERNMIFDLIEENGIGGVILLSGDRHRTDVYTMERNVGYELYEFSTAKLTNHHYHYTRKEAIFSYNKGNFFGLLTFDFTKNDPEVTFNCITREKESVYELTLKRSQLEPD